MTSSLNAWARSISETASLEPKTCRTIRRIHSSLISAQAAKESLRSRFCAVASSPIILSHGTYSKRSTSPDILIAAPARPATVDDLRQFERRAFVSVSLVAPKLSKLLSPNSRGLFHPINCRLERRRCGTAINCRLCRETAEFYAVRSLQPPAPQDRADAPHP